MAVHKPKPLKTLEEYYKEPILNGLLILLVPLIVYLATRDYFYRTTVYWVALLGVRGVVLTIAWACHLRNNYRWASRLTLFGMAFSLIIDLGLLGYTGIHSFYFFSIVVSLLVLAGSFFLTNYRVIQVFSAFLWLSYLWFCGANWEKGVNSSSSMPMEAQLAIPTLGFLVFTALSLGSRQVFQRIILSQQELLTESEQFHHGLAQLIRGIAHRLNTPLGNAKMLLSTDFPMEGEHRELLSDAINISTSLISRLKAFLACSESDSVTVSTFSAHLEVLLKQSSVQGDILLAPGSEKLLQDPRPHYWEAIHLVLKEVLENVALHGTPDRTVKMEFSETAQGQLTLRFANPSATLSPEDLGKYTLPFYSTLNQADHPGLGLYFADHLVKKKLGGRLVLGITQAGSLQVAIHFSGRIK